MMADQQKRRAKKAGGLGQGVVASGARALLQGRAGGQIAEHKNISVDAQAYQALAGLFRLSRRIGAQTMIDDESPQDGMKLLSPTLG